MTRKRVNTGPKGLQWPAIRMAYIQGREGYKTYKEVARSVGCSERIVAAHGTREQWNDMRKQFQLSVQKQVADVVGDELAALMRVMVPKDLKELDRLGEELLREIRARIHDSEYKISVKDLLALISEKHKLTLSQRGQDLSNQAEDEFLQRAINGDLSPEELSRTLEETQNEIINLNAS